MRQKTGYQFVTPTTSINQSYEITRHKYKTTSDPLKKLIKKQQTDGTTEDAVIQRVQTSPFLYDIVLFNQRIFSNLANFCCTDDRNHHHTMF